MAARGVDYADIGQAIGRSGTAVRIDLTSRRAPRQAIQTKLQEWLEQAPAVAAYGPSFRPNGANGIHTGTDADLRLDAAA
jgi:hypothetical protein